jgi:hypothetical protein
MENISYTRDFFGSGEIVGSHAVLFIHCKKETEDKSGIP